MSVRKTRSGKILSDFPIQKRNYKRKHNYEKNNKTTYNNESYDIPLKVIEIIEDYIKFIII